MSKFSHDAASDDDARAMTIPRHFSSNTVELKINSIVPRSPNICTVLATQSAKG